MTEPMVNLTINTFDAKCLIVDNKTIEISASGITDIIDHALQLATSLRRAINLETVAIDDSTLEVFQELEDALYTYSILETENA